MRGRVDKADDDESWTPLLIPKHNGHEAIVSMLLAGPRHAPATPPTVDSRIVDLDT